MKFNKTLIILSLLIIFCISLGAVNAVDADISINDTNNAIVATVESSVLNEEINNLSEGEPYSSEIYEDIKNATGTYNITTDYQIDKTWNISNDNVIIDGNNHTVYGKGFQVFYITGNNVTIKNLNFVDCSAESGGAIYWFGVDGSVRGCNFTDCSAESGGAIYWFGVDGSVSGCNFTDCCAGLDGGAIKWYEKVNGSVSGCNFANCNAPIGGAIIWFGVDGSVSGCNFTDCNATEGGAIYWAGVDGSVSGCSFVDCSAANGGGAINCYSADGSVSGCSFTDCCAGFGGAINWNTVNGSVSGCSFTNCSANWSGGAIYWAAVCDSVKSCNFTNCSVANGSVSGCSFVDCSAIYGGAIIWFGDDGSVGDCSFTNCSASRTGGAIDWNNGTDGSVSGCSFVDCFAGYGGAIDWDNSPDGSVSGCSFVDCCAGFGGVIYINQESLSISNCTSTPSVKAHIYNDGTILSDVIITTLNGDVKSVNYGETIDLTGTVTTCGLSVAGQELSFKVNGNQINAKSDDYGLYSTSYTVDFVGDKNVDATYEGSIGSETVDKGELVSSKVDVVVTVDDVKGKSGDKVKFTAKVNDIYGNPVQGGVVIFGFNGKEYKANVVNGVATVEVVLPKAGTYSATAYYVADENHNNVYTVFTVEVINNPINNSRIPMEHTGNPLIALLIALITLPILRRK